MQLSSLKTYIKQDFKRTDKDTEIVQAINDMINYISVWMPHGKYKYQSWIPTVIEQEDYPLPSNCIHLMHPIRLLDGSATTDSGYALDRITKEKYDELEPNPNRTSPSTGAPYAYTVYSDSILLTKIPDKATYLIEINWTKRKVDLSADADSPELGAEYDEVIKCGALERLYQGMEMYEEAAYWGAKYHDPFGEPIGLLRKLLDNESDKEDFAIDQIENNNL